MLENGRMSTQVFHEILTSIEQVSTSAPDLRTVQQHMIDLITDRLPYYNWTGFYMLDPTDGSMLVLGPFRGAPTEHTRIPVTQGICGAAVAQGETIIIDDVNSDPRYLACSLETRSEIVVPIRANGVIVGEIDIDSHDRGAFGPEDRAFLERAADIIGRFIESHS